MKTARLDVEEAHGIGERMLDEHALGVAGDEGLVVELASLVSRMVDSSWPRSVMKHWRYALVRTNFMFVDLRVAVFAVG